MTIKKYASLGRSSILESLQFRSSLIMTAVGNMLYLLLIYNLWKAIYASVDTDVVNGMTFQDTMIYLVFGSALFTFMEMWMVWNMGDDIQTGRIVVDLLKPLKYRTYLFFVGVGEVIVKFFTTFLPTAIVVFIVSDGAIKLGTNVLLFVLSLFFSMMINFYLNFFVGTICMYTESIWGINVMKEVIMSLFSGALVPLAFFPSALKDVAMALPFQSIVNAPIRLLLNTDYGASECLEILGVQLIWTVALSILTDLFFKVSVKKITVNGG